MNMFKRWYDTDTIVSGAVSKIETLDEDLQEKVAEYMISILQDIDSITLTLDDQRDYIMKRWYDKNIKVSHAIEYLRLAPDELRRDTAFKVINYIKILELEKDGNSQN